MNKINKVAEYVKAHKKEIAITTIAGAVGIVCGIVGHNMYISKNPEELIKLVNEYGKSTHGRTLNEHLCTFLNNTTGTVYPCFPVNGAEKTLKEALGGELFEVLVTDGVDPNTKIAGIMFGTIK